MLVSHSRWMFFLWTRQSLKAITGFKDATCKLLLIVHCASWYFWISISNLSWKSIALYDSVRCCAQTAVHISPLMDCPEAVALLSAWGRRKTTKNIRNHGMMLLATTKGHGDAWSAAHTHTHISILGSSLLRLRRCKKGWVNGSHSHGRCGVVR